MFAVVQVAEALAAEVVDLEALVAIRACKYESSASGTGLAEVYMMRELLKEKTKRMEKEGAGEKEVTADEGKVSAGCFSMMVKKIHPTAVPSSPDFSGKEADQTCDQRTVD
ncbi:hypothetical protein F0562_027393 [Nyssa sinensis]|uniref:Uncharacterized protein n=1 Tax=Nyssa sinensis TaxID=561372 RepID=A0A5J5B8F1_9ASTE|nr:hypothetical protein F0562_027393 [Nyssa sinensis]